MSNIRILAVVGMASVLVPASHLMAQDKVALLRSTIAADIRQPDANSTHMTILMVGDTGFAPHAVTPHGEYVRKHGRKLSFGETTAKIASRIDGDINFANIESVITDRRLKAVPKAYNFAMHSNGAEHLIERRFNLFSLANNHAFDFGASGVRDTLIHADNMVGQGLLAHAGIGLTRKEAAKAPVFSVKNMNVAFASIGIGASNGGVQRASETRAGQLNIGSKEDLALLAHNLSAADADFRLLSVHRGAERVLKPSHGEISAVNRLVEKSDADIMIGHHAHIARGIAIKGNRLIVYGLGNFLHHGTADMTANSGCRDYSIMAKAHVVRVEGERPQIAALEVTPITDTHMQTKPLPAKQAAKRIAVLNGLARQFDNVESNTRGVRFAVRPDGSGLYCLPAADRHSATRDLCKRFSNKLVEAESTYRRALVSCGRISPEPLLAAWSNVEPDDGQAKPRQAQSSAQKVAVVVRPVTKPETESLASEEADASMQSPLLETPKPIEIGLLPSDSKPVRLKKNPSDWPAGMPLAWAVPIDESYAQKRKRWAKKRYSIVEVEKLLIKRGLLSR